MPILDDNTLEYISRSAEQTRRLGLRLGALIHSGQVIFLIGDLGAGKTTLVQGLVQGWGSSDPVTSPTFVLVNEYHRPDNERFFHLDAYRLTSAEEGEDLDIDRMLSEGVLVVEWPERILRALPSEALTIRMTWMAEEQRGLVITANGERYQPLVDEIRQKLYGGY